jgi:hypothetical protein
MEVMGITKSIILIVILFNSKTLNKKIEKRLRIRREEISEGDNRYILVSGSNTVPMIWNRNEQVIIIVESELDGMLIDQEDIAEEVKILMRSFMESAMRKIVPVVPFMIEPEITETWGG